MQQTKKLHQIAYEIKQMAVGYSKDTEEERIQRIEWKLNELFQEAVKKEEKAIDLLRSAYQIALRKGEVTNWEGFTEQLKMFFDSLSPSEEEK